MGVIQTTGAYAGVQELDAWRAVDIRRFHAAQAARFFGSSPYARQRKGPGWYWCPVNAIEPAAWRGPFTSSRRALRHARERAPLTHHKKD